MMTAQQVATIETLIAHFQEQAITAEEPWKRGAYRRACELLSKEYDPAIEQDKNLISHKASDAHNLTVHVVEDITMIRFILYWQTKSHKPEELDDDLAFFLADLKIELATLRAFCHKYPEMLAKRQATREQWEQDFAVGTPDSHERYSPKGMRALHAAIRQDRTMRQ